MSDKMLGLLIWVVFLAAIVWLFYLFMRDHGRRAVSEHELRGKSNEELGAVDSMLRAEGFHSPEVKAEIRRRRRGL